MTDTRETKAKIRRLKQVKTWQLAILLVMAAFVSATFLRLNNVGMIERRNSVIVADKEGDVATLEKRLYDLQRYVAEHMNADPGRVALVYTYERYYETALKEFEARAASQSGNDVVQKIREVCDAQAAEGGWGRFTTQADPRYVACINAEWEKYPAASATETQFTAPPVEPYYQKFTSPLWSPDFAGWSVVVTGVIALIILLRLLVLAALNALVKRKYRRL